MRKEQNMQDSREELLFQLMLAASELTDEEMESVLEWAKKEFEIPKEAEVK